MAEYPDSDDVTQPLHYTTGRIEPIDALYDWQLPYPLDNVVKYLVRHTHKGTAGQDMEKAARYLLYYIKQAFPDRHDRIKKWINES